MTMHYTAVFVGTQVHLLRPWKRGGGIREILPNIKCATDQTRNRADANAYTNHNHLIVLNVFSYRLLAILFCGLAEFSE